MSDVEQLAVRVVDKRREAKDISTFRLAPLEGATLPAWEPGCHVSLTLAEGVVREYSLCGEPTDDAWTIGVQREKAGRGGSLALHDRVRVGDTLTSGAPRNNFPLEDAPSYLFIAGGIGITPLVSMIEAAALRGRPCRVVYLARSRDRMAFVPRLQASGATVEFYPTSESGRPDLGELRATLPPGALTYICGPTGLLDRAREIWSDDEDSLRIEHFVGVAASADEDQDGFEVELAKSGVVVPVAPGESILNAVEAAVPGLSIYQSCHEGVCGSCETAVLDGVPEHRDLVLTKKQRERGNRMMICVSRSSGPRLVLDL